MDIATLVGFVGGLAIVLAAILTGGSLLLFINIPSILIVFGGSAFVVSMKFSLQQMTKAVSIALKAFLFKPESVEELIKKGTELAALARKSGPLALEKVEIKDPYLKRGIMLVVDGTDPDIVREILYKEKNSVVSRHEEGQRIFKSLADVAPAMGMIGTLIGLVQMLANMDDPSSIGPAMAVALLTTLYGAVLANMFAAPVADKLSLRSQEEESLKQMMIDIVLGIAAGHSRAVVQEQLSSYLPANQRPADDAGEDAA